MSAKITPTRPRAWRASGGGAAKTIAHRAAKITARAAAIGRPPAGRKGRSWSAAVLRRRNRHIATSEYISASMSAPLKGKTRYALVTFTSTVERIPIPVSATIAGIGVK